MIEEKVYKVARVKSNLIEIEGTIINEDMLKSRGKLIEVVKSDKHRKYQWEQESTGYFWNDAWLTFDEEYTKNQNQDFLKQSLDVLIDLSRNKKVVRDIKNSLEKGTLMTVCPFLFADYVNRCAYICHRIWTDIPSSECCCKKRNKLEVANLIVYLSKFPIQKTFYGNGDIFKIGNIDEGKNYILISEDPQEPGDYYIVSLSTGAIINSFVCDQNRVTFAMIENSVHDVVTPAGSLSDYELIEKI